MDWQRVEESSGQSKLHRLLVSGRNNWMRVHGSQQPHLAGI